MSYQTKGANVCVVVCDTCGDFSWVSDRHWRQMPESTSERPIHLCGTCQRVALWCSAHQQYHRPEVLHRRSCADCGGLFTSVVADALTRCPSCRRAASQALPQAAQPNPKHSHSLMHRLSSLRASHRRS